MANRQKTISELRALEIFRLAAGMTRNEVSEKIGKTVQTIFRWENGEGEADYKTLAQLAGLYGVPQDELVAATVAEASGQDAKAYRSVRAAIERLGYQVETVITRKKTE